MTNEGKQQYLALDVGAKRIGVAMADSSMRIPITIGAIAVDGTETYQLQNLISEHQVTQLVIGLPRNQQGEETAQSGVAREFANRVQSAFGIPVHMQDESLTSVLAEQRLKASKKPYTKEDIDAAAATIILCDYLGVPYASSAIG